MNVGGYDYPNSFRVGGDHRDCAATPILRALSRAELAWAWDGLDRHLRRQLSKSLRIETPPSSLSEEDTNELARALATVRGRGAHEVARLIATRALPVFEEPSKVRPSLKTLEELLAPGTAVPRSIAHLCLVLLREAKYLTNEQLAVLCSIEHEPDENEDVPCDGVTDPSTSGDARFEWPGESVLGEPIAPVSVLRSLGLRLSPVDLLIVQQLHRPPSNLADGTVAAAARHLTSLEPAAPGPWFVLGYIGRYHAITVEVRPTAVAAMARTVGEFVARCEMDDVEALHRFCVAHWDELRELVTSRARLQLFGPVARCFVLQDPLRAVRLMTPPLTPFRGWQLVLSVAKRRALDLLKAKDFTTAEQLLVAVRSQLEHWLTEPAIGRPEEVLEYEFAAVTLLLARSRRHRSDFRGALELLNDQPHWPSPLGRSAILEVALSHASLTSPDRLRLPQTPKESARLAARLAGARAAIADCVAIAPDDWIAQLMAGAAAIASDDHFAAARHLRAAESAIELECGSQRVAEIRFHRALAELRLLEPGGDLAADDLVSALSDGFQPDPELLLAAIDALEVHESPLVGAVLSVALTAHPMGKALNERLIVLLVEYPSATLLSQALQVAAEQRGRAKGRILFATMRGAAALHEPAALLACVDELEELVDQSGDEDLIRQWEEALASSEALRDLIGANHADVARALLLTRLQRLGDAQGVLTAVYYRVALTENADIDPAQLEVLLDAIGAEYERLRIDDAPHAALPNDAPTTVLFVGGNEVQERYEKDIERDLGVEFPHLTIQWFRSGWSSNWVDVAERVERRLPDAHAIVLMTFTRTHLGQRLRRAAGDVGVPWVSCVGHGRASLEQSIRRAAYLAQARVRTATAATS